jgi:hypothetical protein
MGPHMNGMMVGSVMLAVHRDHDHDASGMTIDQLISSSSPAFVAQ